MPLSGQFQKFDCGYNGAVSGYFGSPRENLEHHGANNETENPDSVIPGDLCTGVVFVGDHNSGFARDARCGRSSRGNSPAGRRARGIA
jgi:hypothetical protein